MKKIIIAVFLATIWVSLSEFARNELLFKDYWVNHYKTMGLVFPSEPMNGAIWGLWSMMFASLVAILSRRFTFLETVMLSWFAGFILMWIVTGNMGVLPFKLLYFAVPLSLLEACIATLIINRVAPVINRD